MPTATVSPALLPARQWRDAEAVHEARADALTAGHRERARRGQRHPVEDFLFTYYSYRPAVLRRWHPGDGVALADAGERSAWRWYDVDEAGVATVDGAAFRERFAGLLRGITGLLGQTAQRAASFGCFGLHEWAMVYRAGEVRHAVPLRLGREGTDAVVEAHELRCTHFDAFRFFTPEAVPRNRSPLRRENQPAMEQPGCLHANMDLYKWAVKLGPLCPGDLLLDAFELARDIRVVDMRASPYDLTDWGYESIRIEEPSGKSAYAAHQRAFAARAEPLRARLREIATPR